MVFAHLIFRTDISLGADCASKQQRGCKWEWVKGEGAAVVVVWGEGGGLLRKHKQVYLFSLTYSKASRVLQLGAKLLSALVLCRQTCKIWVITSQLCVIFLSVWVFHSCLHRSPLWSTFTIIAHFYEISVSYMGTFLKISPIISSIHLCCSSHNGFPEHVITVRLRSTYMSGRNLACFVEPMVQLWCEHDEDKHSNGLQFGIDPSILLVGSMPKQLMQPAIDSPVSCLAEFHSDVTLFSESQVCQMASTSFLYVLSFCCECAISRFCI